MTARRRRTKDAARSADAGAGPLDGRAGIWLWVSLLVAGRGLVVFK
jgi:hypothetical protein